MAPATFFMKLNSRGPKKVGSKPERDERVYKRAVKAQQRSALLRYPNLSSAVFGTDRFDRCANPCSLLPPPAALTGIAFFGKGDAAE